MKYPKVPEINCSKTSPVAKLTCKFLIASSVSWSYLLKYFLFRMVCTDAVSRGMDLGVVDCVISYDAPKFTKNYIHRAGRAARAGRPGTAITLLMESEVNY